VIQQIGLPGPAAPAIAAAPRPRLRLSSGLRSALLLAVAIALAVLAGTKPIGTSPDDENYQIMFEWASQTPMAELFELRDALFFVGAALVSQGGWSFAAFGTLWALAAILIKLTALRQQRLDIAVLLLLYSSYLFWLHDYVQIRFSLALAMLLYAIYGRLPWLRALLLLAAPLAHVAVLVATAVYSAVRWPRIAALVVVIAAGLAFVLPAVQNAIFDLALASVDVYLELMAQGQMDSLNPWAVMPLLQTATLIAMLPSYARLGPPGRREYAMAVIGSLSFYALWAWPVFAFRFHEMFIVFFIVLCARLWKASLVVRILIVAYAFIGVRTVFISQGALLFQV
jgi:EpsG family